MKLAITPWNGRVAPVFDSSERLLILDRAPYVPSMERLSMDGRLRAEELSVDGDPMGEEFDISQKAPAQKVRFLADQGVEQLICGAISKDLEILLRDQGIDVYSFIAGDVDVVLHAWITGQLDTPIYAMPGCFSGRHHRWGRQGSRIGYGRGLEGGYYAKR